jgi:hypothetical protein
MLNETATQQAQHSTVHRVGDRWDVKDIESPPADRRRTQNSTVMQDGWAYRILAKMTATSKEEAHRTAR